MPTMAERVSAFLRSPQGQKLIDQGRRQLAKPENQRRLGELFTKLQNRRKAK